MKTYIYTTEKRHTKRLNRCCRIYRVKNNVPQYIGEVEFSSGATRGAASEVFNKLIELGHLPKSYANIENGYYFDIPEFRTKGFQIIELW